MHPVLKTVDAGDRRSSITPRPRFAIFLSIAFAEFRAVANVAVTPLCET
jgi:hypothetical protein